MLRSLFCEERELLWLLWLRAQTQEGDSNKGEQLIDRGLG